MGAKAKMEKAMTHILTGSSDVSFMDSILVIDPIDSSNKPTEEMSRYDLLFSEDGEQKKERKTYFPCRTSI